MNFLHIKRKVIHVPPGRRGVNVIVANIVLVISNEISELILAPSLFFHLSNCSLFVLGVTHFP